MAKGYWIANNLVYDAESYARYREANAAVFACYDDPEYQAAMALRAAPMAKGVLIIAEGYEG